MGHARWGLSTMEAEARTWTIEGGGGEDNPYKRERIPNDMNCIHSCGERAEEEPTRDGNNVAAERRDIASGTR